MLRPIRLLVIIREPVLGVGVFYFVFFNNLLKYSLHKQLWVPERLQNGSGVDEIRIGVDARPASGVVFEILDAELAIGSCPMRLYRGEIGADDARAGVHLGHCK
jgi:hypothetical protein